MAPDPAVRSGDHQPAPLHLRTLSTPIESPEGKVAGGSETGRAGVFHCEGNLPLTIVPSKARSRRVGRAES